MDSIIKYLFAEQNNRLDKLEAKVNQIEKDIQTIINAIQTSQSTKERLILGRQHGNGEETQQGSNSQDQSRSTDAHLSIS